MDGRITPALDRTCSDDSFYGSLIPLRQPEISNISSCSNFARNSKVGMPSNFYFNLLTFKYSASLIDLYQIAQNSELPRNDFGFADPVSETLLYRIITATARGA